MIIKLFNSYLRHFKLVTLLLLASTILTVSDITLINQVSKLPDLITSSKSENGELKFGYFIIILFFVSIARTVNLGIQSYVQNAWVLGKVIKIRDNLLNSNYKEFKKISEPAYLSAVDKLDMYFRDYIIPVTFMICSIPYAITLILTAIWINPLVIYIILSLLAYFGLFAVFLRPKIKEFYTDVVKSRHNRIEYYYSLIRGLFDIISQERANDVSSDILANENKLLRSNIASILLIQLPKHWIEFFLVLSLVVLNFLSVDIASYLNSILPIAYIAFRLVPVVSGFQVSLTQMQSGLKVRNEINNVINLLTVEPYDKNTKKRLSKFSKIDLICNSLNGDKLSLSCSFKSRNISTLSSPSGFGKSTLMHALAGFMPKTNCTIDGFKINTASLIESIYLITQNHYIDQYKWMELSSTKDTEIQELLNLLELSEIKNFENIGYNGQNLSSGQRNRVALAISIFSKKPLIIFDETLSGIHTSVRGKFLKYLDGVQDKNFIIVTHEQDIINNIQNNVMHEKI